MFSVEEEYSPLCILSHWKAYSAQICFSHEWQFAHNSVFYERRIKHTVYFIATKNVYSADLPWISRLFFFETRTARIAYAPTLPPFGLQSGGRRFRKKEPERRGKAVVNWFLCRIYLHPCEKKFIRTHEPFFTTWLIGSFQSNSLISFRQRNQLMCILAPW